ncbi:MAG: FAD-dependent oxidoreductase [Nesterenkonia sp.]|nr:FAD-dependent oxidoreductase [Nesterenkonia sp.]
MGRGHGGSAADPARRVLVVGGGVAGLLCAYDLAVGGAEVTVVEAEEACGGALASRDRGGLPTDAGAEAFAVQSEAVARLIDELGLAERLVTPNPAGAWLQLPELAAPLPATGLLGIPGDPTADDVVALLGEAAAARAAEDLVSSPEQWRERWEAVDAGQDRISLAELVADRMGPDVVDRLVTPIVSGVHSAAADDLDVEAVAPGLVSLMLREGSLARAVAARRAQAPAGSAVRSLRGGMHGVIGALLDRLNQLGVSVRTGTFVRSLTDVTGADSEVDDIVLAVDGPEAARLAGLSWTDGSVGGSPDRPMNDPEEALGPGVALVTMVLESPALDSAPRGTGMLVSPAVESVAAKAMTHVTAKWAWAAEAFGPSRHLVRLSYGRVGDSATGRGERTGARSTDEELIAAASEDVAVLFGLPGLGETVTHADVVRWRRAVPLSGPEHAGRAARLRSRLAARRGPHGERLHAVGTWFAGTGLSRVVPDARTTAARMLAGEA